MTEKLTSAVASTSVARQWSVGEVLRDWRFPVAMSAIVAPAFITTGLFFHQVHLVESKGWTLGWFATGFIVFAVFKVFASLISGILIDRFGARPMALFFLLPLGAGLLVLGVSNAPLSALIFMALAGLNGGLGQTLMGTLWAEIYGVQHLGAVRGLVFGLMVVVSATGAPVLGSLYDLGVTVETIAFGGAGYCLFGSLVLAWLFMPGGSASRPAG